MNKQEFLTALFSMLEQNNMRYFVFGEYQSLPADTGGSDIDLVVEKDDADTVYSLIKNLAKEGGIATASEYHNTIAYFLRFITPAWGVQIDIFCGGVFWEGAPYYDIKYLRPHIISHNNIKVLDKRIGFYIDYLKEVVHNGKAKEKYRKAVIEAMTRNGKALSQEITEMYGNEATKLIINNLTIEGLNNISTKLQIIMRRRLTSLYHRAILTSKLSKVIRIFSKRPGYVIAVLGTDGSGKSTIIDSLTPWLDECFHGGVKYHHLRPNLLPDIAEVLGKRKKVTPSEKPTVVSDPHSQKPSGMIGSLIRLAYYLVDYTVGYFILVWKQIHSKSHFFIFDRYYYDYYIDQRRSHISLPNWILRLGECVVPSPDLILCLGGDPIAIYSRKPETSLQEVTRQTQVLQQFCSTHPKAVWIDTTQSREESITAAKNSIFQKLFEYKH